MIACILYAVVANEMLKNNAGKNTTVAMVTGTLEQSTMLYY